MQTIAKHGNTSPDTCRKVFDSSNRRVRSLWERKRRFFAIPTLAADVGHKTSRIVPLNGTILDEAKAGYARLQTERAHHGARHLRLTPTLADSFEVHTQRLLVSGK